MRKTLAFVTLLASMFCPTSMYTSHWPQSQVYAQEEKAEKKEQKTLVQQVQDEIQRLDTKQNKTVSEYLTLVNMRRDYAGRETEKLTALIQEACKKINNPKKPEQQYLEATLAIFTLNMDKAVKIINTFLPDPKVNGRIKSDTIVRLAVLPGLKKHFMSPDMSLDRQLYEIAIGIDPTNIIAYSAYFNQYSQDICDMIKDDKDDFGIGLLRKDLQSILAKCERYYAQLVKQKISNPSETYHLARSHFGYTYLLQWFQHVLHTESPTKTTIERNKKLYIMISNKIKRSYDAAIKLFQASEEKYQAHIGKGNTFLSMSHLWMCGIEHYDTAYDSFEQASQLAKTDEEKGKAIYCKGHSMSLKARSIDEEKWNKGELTSLQLEIARKTYDLFQEALQYPLPKEEKDKASDWIMHAKDILGK